MLTLGPLHSLATEPSLLADVLDSPSALGDVWCYLFGGYMIYDTGHTVLFLPGATGADYLHHALSLAAVFARWWTGQVMAVGLAALVTMEVTNPSLHLIWILRKVGLGESRAFLYNAYVFVALYFVFRIVMCAGLLYFFVDQLAARGALATPAGAALMLFAGLTGLSFFWFHKIIRLMTKAQEKVAKAEARKKE
jgi:hypothetical protein